jgi:hypothetical protein
MGDIARWTISICPECGVKLEWGDQWECHHRVLPHDGREVEVVSAEQLRGAVEALRAIAADPQLGGTGHPVDVLARAALEALGLDPTGGQ